MPNPLAKLRLSAEMNLAKLSHSRVFWLGEPTPSVYNDGLTRRPLHASLFAGTLDRLFKVVRTKQGWDLRSRHLAELEVNALSIRPMRRQVIFAGVRGDGLYRCDDMGENRERIGAAILSKKIRALALDPSDADSVFVGTGGEGPRYIKLDKGEFFRSINRSDNWEKIPLRFAIVYALAAP